MISLVTGATRSGKSEWAENLAMRSQKNVIYIATATRYPDDAEWEARLQKHSDRRPENWQTLEVPIALATSILEINGDAYILVDSLGTCGDLCQNINREEYFAIALVVLVARLVRSQMMSI